MELAEKLFKINDWDVTLGDMAEAWLSKATRFTNAPWSNPVSNLTPEQYAQVSLIDLNPPGAEKIKAKIKLPIKSTPGGPVNRNALRNAASRITQTKGVPADKLKAAARKLVRLMREAGIEVGDATLSTAGMSMSKSEKSVEIFKADEEKHIAYGIILRPNVTDLDGDIYTAEEVEKAAHTYMALQAGAADLLHIAELPREAAVMVESMIVPVDFEWNNKQLLKGDWLGGMWIPDDDIWQDVKDGKINAFSIRGAGLRQVIEQSPA